MKKIAFLLALVLLLLPFAACKTNNADGSETDGGSTDAGTLAEVLLTENGQPKYTIIYSETREMTVNTAVRELKSTLEDKTGVTFRATDDYTRDGKPTESTGEIIVGNCRRTDTQNSLLSLRRKDYSVIITEENILLLGWSDALAVKAVNWLIDYLNEEGNLAVSGTGTTLQWKGNYLNDAGVYRYPNLTLCGADIYDYRIVYPAGESTESAEDVREIIGNGTGYMLNMVPDTEPAVELEILVGATNRAESQVYFSGEKKMDLMEYTNTVSGKKLVIAGSGRFSQVRAISQFQVNFNGCGGTLDGLKYEGVALIKNVPASPTDGYRFMQYNILVEYEGWGSGGTVIADVDYRKEGTAAILKNYAPDVAVLCEFFPTWREKLPELLEDMYAFAEIDRENGTSNRTVIIYNKEKFDLLESGYRDIAIKDDSSNALTHRNFRVVTWAVLQDKTTGQQMAVFGTHWETTSTEDRQTQASLMSGVISEISAKYTDIPVVAMGDFNCRGGTMEMLKFLSAANLTDVFGGQSAQMIDHIAIRGGTVTAVQQERENYTSFLSDHYPIWCDVKFD